MPSSWQRLVISAHNATSGTTTMVVPPGVANAGTMNNILFPPPVGITATTGLSPAGWRAWPGPGPPELHSRPPHHALRGSLQIHCCQLVAAFHMADLGLILPQGPFALA
ncbi:uncharacterized protein P174DRAFT_380486 [Aspergillus novofumigatus IBT 16806]|uniref:Uncharacterized protein n=1 Tax=Aspergillus novofumigatus (strain IBT 16806) TaxID=1392255 RepID=A0A2I1BSW5_ASPN1|nr:uncharacterized protein P174DRAFT_380486 [Aspergillus novofumigatus IBT 16806]PKX88452.1 hypothetical protein P174DRAFT_380486 [Aspergillus novofumigatus IBT 16806]